MFNTINLRYLQTITKGGRPIGFVALQMFNKFAYAAVFGVRW